MTSARDARPASSPAYDPRLRVTERSPLLDLNHREAQVDDNAATTATPGNNVPRSFADPHVYDNIWRIRRTIIACINDPYSLEQLRAPRLNTHVIRPLFNEVYETHDASTVYCLLVNRLQFLHEQSYLAHYQSVNTTRALLCEVLASKLMRQLDEDHAGDDGLSLLAHVLVAGFAPSQNGPSDTTPIHARSGIKPARNNGKTSVNQSTALEIAIISDSKLFLSTPATQKVVDSIYTGRAVFTPTSFVDIFPDHLNKKPVRLYDPRTAPLLNQHRLSVPRTRNVLEILHFIILLALYLLVMTHRTAHHLSTREVIFCIYTIGWILDQLASILEHGWTIYTQNLWSFLDISFAAVYTTYLLLRLHGLATCNPTTSRSALDTLTLAAPFLIPRLAFNIFSQNILFLALRDMLARFLLLVLLAVWSFAGFFLALTWLADGRHPPHVIAKWMVWIWFGLDGTGLERCADLHWLLGPVLVVAFAIIANTLFLTLLVATLGAAYARIANEATQEVQFRRAVLTLEGVKADALLSFPPPANLVALLLLPPLRLVLAPRTFHRVSILAVRILAAPLLLLLALIERRTLWPPVADSRGRGTATRHLRRFHVHSDVSAVFDVEPPRASSPPPVHQNTPQAKPHSPLPPLTPPLPSASDKGHEQRPLQQQQRPVEFPDEQSTQARLAALEEPNRRIEGMLKRVCESVDAEATAEMDGER